MSLQLLVDKTLYIIKVPPRIQLLAYIVQVFMSLQLLADQVPYIVQVFMSLQLLAEKSTIHHTSAPNASQSNTKHQPISILKRDYL